MFVIVLWAPESEKFKNLRLTMKPMSDLKPVFESGKAGKRMQAEIEQAQREGQILIQYSTRTETCVDTSAAWTLSGAWDWSKNMKVMHKLERKVHAAGPSVGDREDLYETMADQGHNSM